MRAFLLTICLFCFFSNAVHADETDTLLSRLKVEFGKQSIYDQQKDHRIAQIRASLQQLPPDSTGREFDLCRQLYEEYKSYQYDSAFVYVSRMQDIAVRTHDKVNVNYSRMKLGFILLSAGKYKEAFN